MLRARATDHAVPDAAAVHVHADPDPATGVHAHLRGRRRLQRVLRRRHRQRARRGEAPPLGPPAPPIDDPAACPRRAAVRGGRAGSARVRAAEPARDASLRAGRAAGAPGAVNRGRGADLLIDAAARPLAPLGGARSPRARRGRRPPRLDVGYSRARRAAVGPGRRRSPARRSSSARAVRRLRLAHGARDEADVSRWRGSPPAPPDASRAPPTRASPPRGARAASTRVSISRRRGAAGWPRCLDRPARGALGRASRPGRSGRRPRLCAEAAAPRVPASPGRAPTPAAPPGRRPFATSVDARAHAPTARRLPAPAAPAAQRPDREVGAHRRPARGDVAVRPSRTEGGREYVASTSPRRSPHRPRTGRARRAQPRLDAARPAARCRRDRPAAPPAARSRRSAPPRRGQQVLLRADRHRDGARRPSSRARDDSSGRIRETAWFQQHALDENAASHIAFGQPPSMGRDRLDASPRSWRATS